MNNVDIKTAASRGKVHGAKIVMKQDKSSKIKQNYIRVFTSIIESKGKQRVVKRFYDLDASMFYMPTDSKDDVKVLGQRCAQYINDNKFPEFETHEFLLYLCNLGNFQFVKFLLCGLKHFFPFSKRFGR